MLSAKKAKLHGHEREEYQWPQQVDRTLLVLDRKIEEVTAGLDPALAKRLNSIPVQNMVSIVDYILSMKTEVWIGTYNLFRIHLLMFLSSFIMPLGPPYLISL
ncbi:MAG: hypothetical protein M3297_07135 [Thermoproteota archaeon]|nr:hypothetical protein [Thermoproteota archaeon]